MCLVPLRLPCLCTVVVFPALFMYRFSSNGFAFLLSWVCFFLQHALLHLCVPFQASVVPAAFHVLRLPLSVRGLSGAPFGALSFSCRVHSLLLFLLHCARLSGS